MSTHSLDIVHEEDINSLEVVDPLGLGFSTSISSKAESSYGRLYEVDFIGNGTFQIPQLNLLKNRSIEIVKDNAATLSARGLHHRPKDVFHKDIEIKSQIINSVLKADFKNDIHLKRKKRNEQQKQKQQQPQPKPKPQSGKIPPASLFGSYFQRALAYERVGKIDNALNDYSVCININPQHSSSYYNRGCLYQSKAIQEQQNKDIKNTFLEAAISDFNQALTIDPTNVLYRQNRSILLREMGQYVDAVNDIMICKAIKYDTTVISDLEAGKDVHIDSDNLLPTIIEPDPILACLKLPKYKKTPENMIPVIDFLGSSKFFRKFQRDASLLLRVAYNLSIITYETNEVIFEEGEVGRLFYIILDGEISIMKTKLYRRSDIKEKVVLTKLYRGDAFGENALEGDGIRSAGAVATQSSQLLLLSERDYKMVMLNYRQALKMEVIGVFLQIPLFDTWTKTNLDKLASSAILEQYLPNYSIIKEGEPSVYFYIIKRGMVRMTKLVEKPIKPKLLNKDILNPNKTHDVEIPGIWVLEQNWKTRAQDDMQRDNDKLLFGHQTTMEREELEFNCGELGSGQFFGETAVLNPGQPSPCSVITTSSTEVYKLPSDLLQQLGIKYDTNSARILNEFSALYNPRPEKLAYYYQNKYLWEAKRQKIVEDVSIRSTKLLPLIEASHSGTLQKHKPMKFNHTR